MSQIILFSNLLEMSQGMYRKQEFALITLISESWAHSFYLQTPKRPVVGFCPHTICDTDVNHIDTHVLISDTCWYTCMLFVYI